MMDVTTELEVHRDLPKLTQRPLGTQGETRDASAEGPFRPSRLSRFIPFLALRESRVPGHSPAPAFGRISALDEHLGMLAREFAGASELEFTLACTIVMLRRGIEVKRNLTRFRRIWFWHGRFLCRRLNSRWLISAADTLIDFPRTRAEQATAMAAVVLGTTVKLYETERRLQRTAGSDVSEATVPVVDPNQPPEVLFDGLTAFQVGHGDLMTNFNSRLARFCGSRRRNTASRILHELMCRMRTYDSVYARLDRTP